MVTGAGNEVGLAAIEAVKRLGHEVLAIDADGRAAGFSLADRTAVIPGPTEPGYVRSLCEAAKEGGARAILPTSPWEVEALVASQERLAEAGLAFWLPAEETVALCADQVLFGARLDEEGIRTPVTLTITPPRTNRELDELAERLKVLEQQQAGSSAPSPERDAVSGHWVVRTRQSFGGGTQMEAHSAEDVAWALQRVSDPVVQYRHKGWEFSVDALVGRDGSLLCAVPRLRLVGDPAVGTAGSEQTFSHKGLVDVVANVLALLRLEGPSCAEGIITERGDVYLHEVVPGFSPGLPLTLAAGADVVGGYLDGILGHPVHRGELQFRAGVALTTHVGVAQLI